jgi:hypothetical protein
MGTAEAFETSGWKTAILPFIYVLLYLVGAAALAIISGGVALTVESILQALGISVPTS